MASMCVAFLQSKWHCLTACGMASLRVKWPHVDDIASGVLHGLEIVSVGV